MESFDLNFYKGKGKGLINTFKEKKSFSFLTMLVVDLKSRKDCRVYSKLECFLPHPSVNH